MSAANTDLIVTIEAKITEFEGLEEVIAEMVKAVDEKDPATKQYAFSIDEQKSKLFVMERYADAAGFFAHMQTLEPYAARYFGKIEVLSAAVHMAPGVELPSALRDALTPFGTSFMTFVGRLESL